MRQAVFINLAKQPVEQKRGNCRFKVGKSKKTQASIELM